MRHIHLSISEMPIRSRGLLLIGIIWFLLGLGILTNPPIPISGAWDMYLSDPARVAIWWAASFGAIGAALDKQDGKRDWLALAFCVVPPMMRITSLFWAWVIHLIPGGDVGYERGWYSATIYSCLVALVWLVASIPDTPPPGRLLPPFGDSEEEPEREQPQEGKDE